VVAQARSQLGHARRLHARVLAGDATVETARAGRGLGEVRHLAQFLEPERRPCATACKCASISGKPNPGNDSAFQTGFVHRILTSDRVACLVDEVSRAALLLIACAPKRPASRIFHPAATCLKTGFPDT
jgi:hypothetical protein